ncbi:MAG: DUF1614 domain-containing protein [Candidatus Thorarchaeota archaeon]|nr:MAG: DUF1614 domain-containing protein [Candidatus Thorarchaeota archaeon]
MLRQLNRRDTYHRKDVLGPLKWASIDEDHAVPIVFEDEPQSRSQSRRRPNSPLGIFVFALMSVFLIQAAGFAFVQIGIEVWLAYLIVPGSLVGSLVNIPLYTIKTEPTQAFGMPYLYEGGFSIQLFQPSTPQETKVSINLGGAIIPVAVSSYLLLLNLPSILPVVVATTAVTIAVNRIARVVPNLGIVTPSLLPPLAAVFATLAVGMIFPGIINLYAVAYVAGTLGALIGADFLNLGKLSVLKTDSASIGGAGTWDGVFLTGILAVVLL